MEIIHCNNHCGRLRMLDECDYYFTACGHILCHDCNGKIRDTKCPVCQKQTKSIVLQKLDTKIVNMYFGDAYGGYKKSVESHLQAWEVFTRAHDFQKLQERSFQKIVRASIQRFRTLLVEKESELKNLLVLKRKAEEREEAMKIEKQRQKQLQQQQTQQRQMQLQQQQTQQRQTENYQPNANESMFVVPPTPQGNRHGFTPESIARLNRSAGSSLGGQFRLDKNQNQLDPRSGQGNMFGPSSNGVKSNGVANGFGSNSSRPRQPFENARSANAGVANGFGSHLSRQPFENVRIANTGMASRLTMHSPKDLQNGLPSAQRSPASSVGGRSVLHSPNSMASGMFFRCLQR